MATDQTFTTVLQRWLARLRGLAAPMLPTVIVSRRLEFLLLGATILTAIMLRLPFLAWGLPGGLHPDEKVITEPAVDLAERNSFEPDIYLRPNHLEIKLSYLLYQAYARLIARAPVEVAYAESVDPFLVMSRSVSTVFAIALVVLGYMVARHFGAVAGLTMAILLAVHPFYVEHSLYATPDIPLAASSMLVIFALLRYVSTPTAGFIALASFGVALGVSSKYPGAIATIMIAIVVTAVAMRDRTLWRWMWHGLLAIASSIGMLFIISPNLFTNITAVIEAFERESRSTHAGADGLSTGEKMLFYMGTYVSISGMVLTALTVLGLALVVRRRSLAHVPLFLGLVYLVALSNLGLHWARWATPMFLTFLLLAALAVQWLFDRFLLHRVDLLGRVARASMVLALSMSLLALLLSSISFGVRLNAPDTRLVAIELAAELGITEQNAIYEGYSPLKPNGRRLIFDQFELTSSGLRPIDDSKEFLVLSSGNHHRYFREEKYQFEQQFYLSLRSEFELVGSVSATAKPRPKQLFELETIVSAVAEIAEVARGGVTGPRIEFRRVS